MHNLLGRACRTKSVSEEPAMQGHYAPLINLLEQRWTFPALLVDKLPVARRQLSGGYPGANKLYVHVLAPILLRLNLGHGPAGPQLLPPPDPSTARAIAAMPKRR
jgi:hypothetical protein